MDTYTLFSYPPGNFIVDLVIWTSLALSTAAVFYWAATIENDIENNPGD